MADLPVREREDEILREIRRSRVTVITAETGSGKSTEVPQMIFRENRSERIIVTQPRRIAAMSLARRVGELVGAAEGRGLVAYTIRFKDTAGKKTRIRYVTDGILLSLLAHGRRLRCTTLILDEVHERSVRTDVTLGLAKRLLSADPELKVVLMSATASAADLAAYFRKSAFSVGCIAIPGKTFPVTVRYLPRMCTDYIQSSLDAIRKIISDESKAAGAKSASEGLRKTARERCILVFLSGLDDINDLEKSIQGIPGVEVLKMHSSLGEDEQARIFGAFCASARMRVVLATNIAETSLTIPGVKWVIDTGVQKLSVYKGGIESLGIVKISKASALQRAGRAGRTSPGVCYRLYSEATFAALDENAEHEVLRADLAGVVLTLLVLGIDPRDFDFITHPGIPAIEESFKELFLLGLVDEDRRVLPLGKTVSELPLDPFLSKFLVLSRSYQVESLSAAVCAMVTAGDSFLRRQPPGRAETWEDDGDEGAFSLHPSLASSPSDLVVLAKAFFVVTSPPAGRDRIDLCNELGVSCRHINRAEQIYRQILKIRTNSPRPAASNTERAAEIEQLEDPHILKRLHSCATASFSTRFASLQPKAHAYLHHYTGNLLYIHPLSCLFRKGTLQIGFVSTFQTTRPYIQCAFPFTS